MLFVEIEFKLCNMILCSEWSKCMIKESSMKNWFEWAGQFSNQMFSKWNIKILANVGPKGEPIATPSHC